MERSFEIPELFFEAEHHCMVSTLKYVLGGSSDDMDHGGSTSTSTPTGTQHQLQPSDTSWSSSSSPLPTSSGCTAGNMFLEADAAGNHDMSGHHCMENLGSIGHEKNINASTSKKEIPQKKKKKKSGKIFRGVRQRSNTWVAEIWDPHRGKLEWLGTFASAEEAARAYDRKAIEYRGDAAFPFTNFPLDDYPEELLRARQCLRNDQEVGLLAIEPIFVTNENIDSTQALGSSPTQNITVSANAAAYSGATLTDNITATAATDEAAVFGTTMEDAVDPHGLVDDGTFAELMDSFLNYDVHEDYMGVFGVLKW